MPGRSALAVAVDARAEWDTTDYLLAELIDRQETNNWLLVEINSEDGVPVPEPIPRPGDSQEETNPEPGQPGRTF